MKQNANNAFKCNVFGLLESKRRHVMPFHLHTMD